MLPIRRDDVSGFAVGVYIPRWRGARHFLDGFSVALWFARKGVPPPGAEPLGTLWAWEWAQQMAALVPGNAEGIAFPPPVRCQPANDLYLAGELAAGVSRLLGIPLIQPLRWGVKSDEPRPAAARRSLRRRVHCDEDLRGLRVCLVDDVFTTGATLSRCARALCAAGAEPPIAAVTLAVTEVSTQHGDLDHAVRGRHAASAGATLAAQA